MFLLIRYIYSEKYKEKIWYIYLIYFFPFFSSVPWKIRKLSLLCVSWGGGGSVLPKGMFSGGKRVSNIKADAVCHTYCTPRHPCRSSFDCLSNFTFKPPPLLSAPHPPLPLPSTPYPSPPHPFLPLPSPILILIQFSSFEKRSNDQISICIPLLLLILFWQLLFLL